MSESNTKKLLARWPLGLMLVSAGVSVWLFGHRPVDGPSKPLLPALKNISLQEASPRGDDWIRPELANALGLRDPMSDSERLDVLRGMTDDNGLSETECEALLAALLERRPPAVDAGWHSAYVHAISCVLQHQEGIRERFARVLATIARDQKRDEVVRDYAMQHLRQLWDRAGNAGSLRALVEGTFRELVEKDRVLAASALLSLHLLGTPAGAPDNASKSSDSRYKVADADLAPLVSNILKEAPSPDTIRSRMTASRVAGDRRLSSSRAPLLDIARNTREHTLVRMAAISALGEIGDATDLKALSSLEVEDPRLSRAVRGATAVKAPKAQ